DDFNDDFNNKSSERMTNTESYDNSKDNEEVPGKTVYQNHDNSKELQKTK
ncbi:17283_t:CDS:1, partial [Gigaspora rosea]